VSQKITDSLSEFPIAAIKLCVRGRSGSNLYQATPTSVNWTRDTKPSGISLIGLPNGVSTLTAVSVYVLGAGLVTYKYKLGDVSLSCKSATDKDWISVGANSTSDLSKKPYSAYNSAKLNLDLSIAPFTTYTQLKFCVVGFDKAGNASPILTRTWSKDIFPPVVTLSDVPQLWTNQTTLNIKVQGDGLVNYRYKLGPKSTTDCNVDSSDSSYSGFIDSATRISNNIETQADALFQLCVIGKDLAGNVMPLEKATKFEWNKDTAPPVVQLQVAPISYSNVTSLKIIINKIGGSDAGSQVVSYRYKLAASNSSFSCTTDDASSPYSTSIDVSTPITKDISSWKHGKIHLCVVDKDQAGNIQSTKFASEYEWMYGEPPKIQYYRTLDSTSGRHFVCASSSSDKGDLSSNWDCSSLSGDKTSSAKIEGPLMLLSVAKGQNPDSKIERVPLYACSTDNNSYYFVSTAIDCEIKTNKKAAGAINRGILGYFYPSNAKTNPTMQPLYRYERKVGSVMDSYLTRNNNCEGESRTAAVLLGYTGK
jgi:hypothetical protein